MTEKQPAPDKKETSTQEGNEISLGRLHFFFAFLGYALYLVLLIVILSKSGVGGFWGSIIGDSLLKALLIIPLGFLMVCRLANAGCPGSSITGLIISVGFWYLMLAASRIIKNDPQPAITILAIFALIVIILLVIPPKAKPESSPDKDAPEN